jgi:hypothetical protein
MLTLLTLIRTKPHKACRLTGFVLDRVKPLIVERIMKKQSMRETMPGVTAFIDGMRAAFGREMIDGQIRRGMNGEPTFFASENGHQVGTRLLVADSAVTWDRVTGIAVPARRQP